MTAEKRIRKTEKPRSEAIEKPGQGGERIRRAAEAADVGLDRARAQANERAAIVSEGWDNFHGKNSRGGASFTVGGTVVNIAGIEFSPSTEDSPACVHVWTGKKRGSPQYRLVNPPILVEDSNGEVELVEESRKGKFVTTRYREDPVKAVVEAIASVRGSR